jgi:Transposase IS66 family/RNase_H superfamily
VRAARGDDDLVGIGVDDQVRVMRNDDDLPAQLGMAEARDQLVENRFGIEILFGLVDDQRPVVIAVDRQIEKQENDAARAGRKLLDVNAFILNAVGDLDVIGSVEPCGDVVAPFPKALMVAAIDGRVSDQGLFVGVAEGRHGFCHVAARAGFPDGQHLGLRGFEQSAAALERAGFAHIEKVFALLRPSGEGTPVYLDVEGLPDRDFYYLIGLRFQSGQRVSQHSLWAANENDEKRIWKEFLGVLSRIKKPVLIHYGSFETTFLKRMYQKYGELVGGSRFAEAITSAVNLLSVTFAKVYFPTFSNGIKEIAKYLGFEWENPAGSGLQSTIWRSQWEASGGAAVKQSLLIYNANDCEALEVVANKLLQLQRLSQNPEESPDIVFTASLKWKHPFGFKRNKFALTDLDTINKAAYWDYQRERVYVKSHGIVKRALKFASHQKKSVRPNKIIECSRPRSCARCGASKIYQHKKGQKTVFDLKFAPNGIKRWVVRYTFFQYYCQICKTTFKSPKRNWTRSKFGSEIKAYALYQNIELRLPQETVDRSLEKLFGLPLALGTTNNFKEEAAEKYQITYNTLIKGLTSGPLLHADETKISIKTGNGFVWVFANMQQVVYIYNETREANILHTLLKNFTGILVSDFYPAYEGIQCSQQKCLIHLIRDLNDDLLKYPFDEEFKLLARAFAELLRPMVETIDRHGLQSRFLKQHFASVDRFYQRLWKLTPRSEVASKTKQRFEKNRDTLFTLLEHDGVPWNNNNAEHAVKAFATLRRVIKGVTSEAGLRDYLVLLSICETCNYQGLDFLDFLRSGETDIAAFADSRQKIF